MKYITIEYLNNRVINSIVDKFPKKFILRGELLSINISISNHHYLELFQSNCDSKYSSIKGIIWSDSYDSIIEDFLQTSLLDDLQPDNSYLFHCYLEYHSQYGLSVVINKIEDDPENVKINLLEQNIKLLKLRNDFDNLHKLTLVDDLKHITVISPNKSDSEADFLSSFDILENLMDVEIDIINTSFQGPDFKKSFMHAIDTIDLNTNLIIIIRGGGSSVDLLPMNDLDISIKLLQLNIALFTGIGHEPDNSLLDFISSKRFSTPSKVVSFLKNNFLSDININLNLFDTILYKMMKITNKELFDLDKFYFSSAFNISNTELSYLNNLHSNIINYSRFFIKNEMNNLFTTFKTINFNNVILDEIKFIDSIFNNFNIYSHNKILNLGFSLIYDNSDKLIKNATELRSKRKFKVLFSDGTVSISKFSINNQ